MTLQNFQDYLHSLYKANGSTPSSTSDEWTHRKYLLYAAINLWDTEKGMLWNELWTTLADAATGDKTVNSSDVDYDMPTDLRFLGSFVRTTNSAGKHTYWRIISPAEAELYKNTDATACYVTGNKKAGFDLHFLKQPTVGDTINYPYYKEPFQPSLTTDVLEMNDPYFAIYYALSVMHAADRDGDLANRALDMAQDRLAAMKVKNMMLPDAQTNKVSDRDFQLGVAGFGQEGSRGVSRYGGTL